MAPEILAEKIHTFSIDFYALGIIIHECILGYRPYTENDITNFKNDSYV